MVRITSQGLPGSREGSRFFPTIFRCLLVDAFPAPLCVADTISRYCPGSNMACSRRGQSSVKHVREGVGQADAGVGEFLGGTVEARNSSPPTQPSQDTVLPGKATRGGRKTRLLGLQTRTASTHNCQVVGDAIRGWWSVESALRSNVWAGEEHCKQKEQPVQTS